MTGSDQAQVATSRAAKLLSLLAPRLSGILNFIAHSDVSIKRKTALLDASLTHLNLDVDYEFDQTVLDLILAHYANFESLTSRGPSPHKSHTMPALARMGVRLPALDRLNDYSRSEAVRLGCYVITGANLTLLTRQDSLALDAIADASPAVYSTVIGHLDDYLAVLDQQQGEHPSVKNPESFASILNSLDPEGDLAGPANNQSIAEVVLRADPACRVDDLAGVPSAAWGALVRSGRTPLTFSNTRAYIELNGVDQDLGGQLAARHPDLVPEGTPTEGEGAISEDDRQHVALLLINASDVIPDPHTRADLAGGCNPTVWIPVEEVEPETGELAGLLIRKELIADTSDAFTSGLMPDWPTREHAMSCSKSIDTFISPEVVPANQLAEFFSSTRVRPETKLPILDALEMYPATVLRKACEPISKFAVDHSVKLDVVQLEALQTAGLPDDSLAKLLANADLPLNDLLRLLNEMSDPTIS